MSFKEYASKEYVEDLYLRKSDLKNIVHDYIILRDGATGCTYYAYIENGIWITSCKIVKIQITKMPDKTIYTEGEVFDTTGMVVSAVLENGNTVTLDDGYVIIPENVTKESNVITISYTDKFTNTEFTTTIEVEATEFDPTIELLDFNYTANADGTYTITGWKQTLNGEPSTEMIVPDNSLIIV